MDDNSSNINRPPRWEDLPENTRRYIRWNIKFSKYLPKLYIIGIIVMLILLGVVVVVQIDGKNEMAHRSLQNSRASAVDKVAHQLRMFNIKMKRYPESLGELVPVYLKYLPTDVAGGNIDFLYARSKDGKRFHVGVKLESYDGGIILGSNTPHPLTYDSDFNSVTADYLDGFDGVDPAYDLEDGR